MGFQNNSSIAFLPNFFQCFLIRKQSFCVRYDLVTAFTALRIARHDHVSLPYDGHDLDTRLGFGTTLRPSRTFLL